MNIRVLYNILLVRLNIREVLPIEAIRRIRTEECGEPLVTLSTNDFLILNQNTPVYGRVSVIEKLYEVEKILKEYSCRIGVFEIYRDEKTQISKRNREYENIKKQYPDYNENELQKVLNSRIANITTTAIGGHQTGGAIDCTLCSLVGQPLDMGTNYLEFNNKTRTHYENLTNIQKRNRSLLCTIMQRVGFINYPNEWWHFSYGDKMWAAYKNKSTAIYGYGIFHK